jgi:hypothetical protein
MSLVTVEGDGAGCSSDVWVPQGRQPSTPDSGLRSACMKQKNSKQQHGGLHNMGGSRCR